MRFGILTISDSCYYAPQNDKSGPTLLEAINEVFPESSFDVGIVPDEIDEIKKWILSKVPQCNVVLTTGGTGFAHRDVTPEATKAIIQRSCPGIVTALLMEGLKKTPMAALSRQEAGIIDKCLIVNLPGSPKACLESVPILAKILPHAVAILENDTSAVKSDHKST